MGEVNPSHSKFTFQIRGSPDFAKTKRCAPLSSPLNGSTYLLLPLQFSPCETGAYAQSDAV